MADNIRRKADRARQFMPFASLRGYYDLIREKERIREPKRELTEDAAEELSAALGELRCGMLVKIRFYDTDHYENTTGIITAIDTVFRRLTLVRRCIPFDDILSAEQLERPTHDDRT